MIWKIFLLLFWSIGNLVVFSTVLYVKYSISGNSFDTFLLGMIMVFWVFGQLKQGGIILNQEDKKK